MIGIILQFVGNGLGLYAAGKFIDGVTVPLDNLADLGLATLVLTLINLIAKPILKLVLSPVIVLTFGLAIIAINALTLYALDYLLPTITITGLIPLIYATILTSAINVTIRAIR